MSAEPRAGISDGSTCKGNTDYTGHLLLHSAPQGVHLLMIANEPLHISLYLTLSGQMRPKINHRVKGHAAGSPLQDGLSGFVLAKSQQVQQINNVL